MFSSACWWNHALILSWISPILFLVAETHSFSPSYNNQFCEYISSYLSTVDGSGLLPRLMALLLQNYCQCHWYSCENVSLMYIPKNEFAMWYSNLLDTAKEFSNVFILIYIPSGNIWMLLQLSIIITSYC